ncbi:zinc finger protein ZFP2-like isoform X1 [Pieris napi]|uniref:zinc finger protein ZFP2-like isoform X1 n=1 Tax=Pieris napi TaxID=78633 RepID=UPI001FB8D66A|nr:zinc finger protein ZFP2-like isoform X1 [Pieris napi]
MESVKACRICLKMDTKFSVLHPKSLGLCYELLTGTSVQKGLIKYACFECAALLKKYFCFRQKSLRSQFVLENILEHYGKITSTHINKIDRQSLLLSSNLSINEIQLKDNELLEDIPCAEEKFSVENNDDVDFHWTCSSDEEPKIKNEENVVIEVPVKKEVAVKAKKRKAKQQKAQRWIRKKKNERKQNSVKKGDHKKSVPATFSKTVADEELYKHVAIVNLTVDEQYEEVRRRQESSNYLNSFYKCEICFKGFIDARAWQNHNKQHNEGEVQCDVCKLRFRSKVILSRHVKYHSTKYHCLQCPYISQGISQAKLHLLWHRGVTYDCDHCGEKFRQRMSYITHLRMKHPSDWVCGVCGNTFVSQMGLLQHKSLRHTQVNEKTEIEENPEAPFCELCDVKFASPEAFKRHLVQARKHVATAENKYGCRECGESFKTPKELRDHTRARPECLRKPSYSTSPAKNNGDPRSWPMNCPHCGKEIANAYIYSWHFRTAHPEKDYYAGCDSICDVCGKGFPKRLLSAHIAKHSVGGPNELNGGGKCETCGKVCVSRSSLYAHRRTHSEARPHVCTVCGMGFKAKSVLQRHGLVHTGEKPYTCELCGKSFSQSNTCQQHIRTVHHKLPPLYVSRSKRERMMRRHALAQ